MVTVLQMRNTKRRMPPRKDGHGIRIPQDLWDAMGARAALDRRNRTQWAHAVLEAAAAGRAVLVPQFLGARLAKQADRHGWTLTAFCTALLEEGLVARETPRRRRR
jgi:hypothetical protein